VKPCDACAGQVNWIPVILLTQVGEAAERAMALEEGADDYLNKPSRRTSWGAHPGCAAPGFPGTPPVGCLGALLRRAAPGPPLAPGQPGGSGSRPDPQGAGIAGIPDDPPDELVSRERLLDVVGDGASCGDGGRGARIAELRRTLGDNPDQPIYIETAPSLGYRFIGRWSGLDEQALEDCLCSLGHPGLTWAAGLADPFGDRLAADSCDLLRTAWATCC